MRLRARKRIKSSLYGMDLAAVKGTSLVDDMTEAVRPIVEPDGGR